MITTTPFYLSEAETEELDELALRLVEQAIRYSELNHLLPTNEAADEFAVELRREVREFVSRKIDEWVSELSGEGK